MFPGCRCCTVEVQALNIPAKHGDHLCHRGGVHPVFLRRKVPNLWPNPRCPLLTVLQGKCLLMVPAGGRHRGLKWRALVCGVTKEPRGWLAGGYGHPPPGGRSIGDGEGFLTGSLRHWGGAKGTQDLVSMPRGAGIQSSTLDVGPSTPFLFLWDTGPSLSNNFSGLGNTR